MRLKLILTTIVLGLHVYSYACKCGGPGTVEESYKSTDLIVYGRVITKDTVVLSETIKNEDVKKIKDGLKDDKQKLQQFEMTYVVKVELEIIENFKGEIHQKTVVIYTPLLSATCGFRFEKGKDYIIYASKRNFLTFLFQKENENKRFENENTFWTTHCMRTTEYVKLEADELRALNKK
jgi:hypothetical protein